MTDRASTHDALTAVKRVRDRAQQAAAASREDPVVHTTVARTLSEVATRLTRIEGDLAARR